MSVRKTYKILSWDPSIGAGIATDGTQFDGEYITFSVYSSNLPAEYNGFLDPGDVISADEDAYRVLTNIFIEHGARAVRPAEEVIATLRPDLTDTEVEQIVAFGTWQSYPESVQTTLGKPGNVVINTNGPMTLAKAKDEIRSMKMRISRIERWIEDQVDDHR